MEGALDEAIDAAQAAQSDATQALADAATADGKAVAAQTDVDDLVTLSGVGVNSTHLGTFTGSTIADSQTNKQALQALETKAEANAALLAGWDWQNSVLDYVDNTAVPPTEVTGNRYLLDATGASHANWDGAAALSIVEFNGTSWVATAPAVGMVISVEDETTSVRQYSGSAWDQKFFESTTASTGLTKVGFDVRLADASASAGIVISSGAISANVDDSTIALVGNAIVLKDLGVTNAKVSASAAIVESKLSLDYSTSGLNTAVTTAQSDIDTHKDGTANKHDLSEIDNETDGNYTDVGTAQAAIDALDTQVKANADSIAAMSEVETVAEVFVAGEALLADTLYAVRLAKGAETAGRVFKADKDASSNDNFHVIGLVYSGSAIAIGENATVVKAGKMDLGAAHSLTVGEVNFLGATGLVTAGGANGASAPSTASHAAVQVCVGRTANILEVRIQEMGVN
ncbi:MAG: hypothetical protein DRP09_16550 [Candidatus Thorarchaeota archaeon]|nr:MAG: hypothetical protein DRP09_16550 [Candidatus Thorarchaeota archaeon]